MFLFVPWLGLGPPKASLSEISYQQNKIKIKINDWFKNYLD